MKRLLNLAHLIDALNNKCATLAKWAVFAACVISAGNAVVRYTMDISSNGWLEIQWYLFTACVMLGASQVLRVNEHVRVDVLYARYPTRMKVVVDLLGLAFFLLPTVVVLAGMSYPLFERALVTHEMSSNSGGLIRWPVLALLPLGFALLGLQGVSEIIKRIGWLTHQYEMETNYERPLQ